MSEQIKVGMFWYVTGKIVGQAVPLKQAEPYGEALQYGGHHDFWEALRPATVAERRLKARAYDAYPRGRAVYFPARQTLRVFVDACLDNHLDKILDFFGYGSGPLEVVHDEHYQCAGCSKHFLE